MAQDKTPIFVYENADGQILGHLFVTIKEVSDNPVLHPIKPSSSKTCVSIKQRVDKRSVINSINSLLTMPRKLVATT